MSGQHDMAVGGGVESMSRIGIGASGGAWPVDPSIALKSYFMPQGISADLIATKYGFTRAQCDEYAVESQKRTAVAWQEGYFGGSVVPVKDPNGLTILARTSIRGPTPTCSRWPRSSRRSCRWASSAASMRSRCRRIPRSSSSSMCIMPAIRPASSTAPPRC